MVIIVVNVDATKFQIYRANNSRYRISGTFIMYDKRSGLYGAEGGQQIFRSFSLHLNMIFIDEKFMPRFKN